jgi:hypothetical protein
MDDIIKELRRRKHWLRMPAKYISRGRPISRLNVLKVLRCGSTKGIDRGVYVHYVSTIANALGCELKLDGLCKAKTVEQVLDEAVTKKAKWITGMTQGTMLLESQGVSQEVLDEITEDNKKYFLANRRKLWG